MGLEAVRTGPEDDSGLCMVNGSAFSKAMAKGPSVREGEAPSLPPPGPSCVGLIKEDLGGAASPTREREDEKPLAFSEVA